MNGPDDLQHRADSHELVTHALRIHLAGEPLQNAFSKQIACKNRSLRLRLRRGLVLEKGLLSIEFVNVGPLESCGFLAGVPHDEKRKAVAGKTVGFVFDDCTEVVDPLKLNFSEVASAIFRKRNQNAFNVSEDILMLLLENLCNVGRKDSRNAVNHVDDRRVYALIDS